MKKIILTLSALCFFAGLVSAQTPDAINYQGVARDAAGVALPNKAISLQFNVRANSATGSILYTEIHSVTTNSLGLFSVQIGKGTVLSGNFSSIDWAVGAKYLETEMDDAGGANFLTIGTSQLVSVPYAFHARTVEIDSVDDADSDPSNEFQTLSKTGNLVSLSNGGGNFTDDIDDADNDPNNEFQTLSRSGNSISLSNGGGSVVDSVDDADNNPTNEFQTISKSGSTVTLSNGGGSFTDDVVDSDASTTNELQSLSISGQSLSISSGNTISLPSTSIWNDLGTEVRPASFENVESGGDFYASSGNGVINLGGGIISTVSNVISDVASPVITISTGDEDLYIDGTLEVSDNCYKTGGGSWLAISDRRTKRDIRPFSDGLDKVMDINPVWFKYKEKFGITENPDKDFVGVIAQDMQQVAPYMVQEVNFFQEEIENEDGTETYITKPGIPHLTYDATALDYLLVNSVKEMKNMMDKQNEIMNQQSEILELQSKKIKALEEEIAKLKGDDKALFTK